MISGDLDLAVQFLKAGDIIGFPTETVYGLAGNALNPTAIQKIYAVKNRPSRNPLIVHGAGLSALTPLIDRMPPLALRLAEEFWPGPLTLVLPRSSDVPDAVTGGKPTVALRVPDHKTALSLLEKIPFPLVAPSANPFGSTSPTRAIHVEKYFKGKIPMVLDGGDCRSGLESTIIGFDEEDRPRIYRPGSVTPEELKKVLGFEPKIHLGQAGEILAPGMYSRHYAPQSRLVLSTRPYEDLLKNAGKKMALLLFSRNLNLPPHCYQICLSPTGDLTEAAARFYDALHQLDELQPDLIIAEAFPDEGLGAVINEKLKRAAQAEFDEDIHEKER